MSVEAVKLALASHDEEDSKIFSVLSEISVDSIGISGDTSMLFTLL